MKESDYKDRFIQHMIGAGIGDLLATAECEAWIEQYPEVLDDPATPKSDAEEAMSYWND